MLSTHINRARGLIQLPSLAEQGMCVQGSSQKLNSDIQSSQQWLPGPSALSCCHWDTQIPLSADLLQLLLQIHNYCPADSPSEPPDPMVPHPIVPLTEETTLVPSIARSSCGLTLGNIHTCLAPVHVTHLQRVQLVQGPAHTLACTMDTWASESWSLPRGWCLPSLGFFQMLYPGTRALCAEHEQASLLITYFLFSASSVITLFLYFPRLLSASNPIDLSFSLLSTVLNHNDLWARLFFQHPWFHWVGHAWVAQMKSTIYCKALVCLSLCHHD